LILHSAPTNVNCCFSLYPNTTDDALTGPAGLDYNLLKGEARIIEGGKTVEENEE